MALLADLRAPDARVVGRDGESASDDRCEVEAPHEGDSLVPPERVAVQEKHQSDRHDSDSKHEGHYGDYQ
jgi:hypothetical protein